MTKKLRQCGAESENVKLFGYIPASAALFLSPSRCLSLSSCAEWNSPLSLSAGWIFHANSSRSIWLMLITDVLHCPQCWRACMLVNLRFSYQSIWFFLKFKDPLRTKCRFLAFENLISLNQIASAVALSVMLIIFPHWLTLKCLPWGLDTKWACGFTELSSPHLPSAVLFCWS